MQDPVGMEVVDAVQYLIEETFDHTLGSLNGRLLAPLDGSVELYDVLKEGEYDTCISYILH